MCRAGVRGTEGPAQSMAGTLQRSMPDRVRDLSHQVPMVRGGTSDEVAEAIVWLMSPAASYTTATLMDVSGGR